MGEEGFGASDRRGLRIDLGEKVEEGGQGGKTGEEGEKRRMETFEVKSTLGFVRESPAFAASCFLSRCRDVPRNA